MSRIFAYARVSTLEQTTRNQLGEIRAAGFDLQARRVITETISGLHTAMERPGFAKLVDRLGRTAMDVRKTVDHLAGQGIKVHCLAIGGVDRGGSRNLHSEISGLSA